MRRRIHIVGSSPRTGTTLMVELVRAGFEIDAYDEHETAIFAPAPENASLFVSKRPQDVLVAAAVLAVNPDVFFVHMVRDPRDVVVSCHGRHPDRYWSNLRIWHRYRRAARAVEGHPRFVTVRYEDLVRDPDGVQRFLAERMPFLVPRGQFSAFHRVAAPSADARDALGGVRPITPASIGGWRHHKPRLVAQLALHGSIDRDLVELGYEPDAQWHAELEGVVAANGRSKLPDHTPRLRVLARDWERYRALSRYRRDLARERGPLVS